MSEKLEYNSTNKKSPVKQGIFDEYNKYISHKRAR